MFDLYSLVFKLFNIELIFILGTLRNLIHISNQLPDVFYNLEKRNTNNINTNIIGSIKQCNYYSATKQISLL